MRGFFIDVPYVSSGLRRTYKKRLEVYEGDVDVVKGERITVKADTIHKYTKAKGWVKKSYNGYEYRSAIQMVHSLPSVNNIHDSTIYVTLELAQAAKLLKIKEMAVKYEAELKDLHNLFKRNVPDVTKAVEELGAEYPELFV